MGCRLQVNGKALADAQQIAFDSIGERLTQLLAMRKRSPAAREDRLSFFDETTPEEMSQYQPEQVAVILRQRDEAVGAELF